jgi:hypothetical protein
MGWMRKPTRLVSELEHGVACSLLGLPGHAECVTGRVHGLLLDEPGLLLDALDVVLALLALGGLVPGAGPVEEAAGSAARLGLVSAKELGAVLVEVCSAAGVLIADGVRAPRLRDGRGWRPRIARRGRGVVRRRVAIRRGVVREIAVPALVVCRRCTRPARQAAWARRRAASGARRQSSGRGDGRDEILLLALEERHVRVVVMRAVLVRCGGSSGMK